MPDPVLAARYQALLLAGLARESAPSLDRRSRVLVVDVASQRLGLLEDGRLTFDVLISTAKNGLGCEEGSFRTPTGWHRIHARIGAEAEPGAVFRSRVATGNIWRGEVLDEDLILSRVLTLDGLEAGWNHGPGRDSLERFIYLHGTNQESQLGTPVSHGCVRLANADVIGLFDRVAEGDPVLIAENLPGDAFGLGRLHFAGLAGSGMSALAQFVAMKGGRASGSDRSFDRGQRPESRAQLEALGIAIHPQDGSGLEGAGPEGCAALVVSTAVEEEVPDVMAARRLGVPVLHRSELLAHLVARYRTLAVTGTSGKSTTVAMIFEILRGAGRDPSVITGGEMVALQREGRWGNAWAGASDLLVIEADESDGSVVRYHPALGVILNLQRDHKEMEAVAEMFRTFRAQVREGLVVGEAENLREFTVGAREPVPKPPRAATMPGGMLIKFPPVSRIAFGDTEKEGPAGRCGSSFKGADAEERPPGIVPPASRTVPRTVLPLTSGSRSREPLGWGGGGHPGDVRSLGTHAFPGASGSNHVDPLCSSRLPGGTPPGAPSAAHGGFGTGSRVFGFGAGVDFRAEELHLGAEGSTFRVKGTAFRLPAPGRHNVENALAAMAACQVLDVPLEAMVEPLAAFAGVARRFQVLGSRRGITVVDDFGHNPAKVAASIRAAHLRVEASGGRVLAVFQPHGFGPLKFLRADFVEAFAMELAAGDRLWFLDVFYAGGTAARDISSAEVIADIAARGVAAEWVPSREWLVDRLATEAREGDLILLMGARDPSLTGLAEDMLAALAPVPR